MFTSYKILAESEIETKMLFIQSLGVGIVKHQRALTLDGGTSPLPYSPQSPQRSPTYIQNTFKSEMKNISAESPVKPQIKLFLE